jgi:hypothetical protein
MATISPSMKAGNGVRLTLYGGAFLDRLLEEGLEVELKSRAGEEIGPDGR